MSVSVSSDLLQPLPSPTDVTFEDLFQLTNRHCGVKYPVGADPVLTLICARGCNCNQDENHREIRSNPVNNPGRRGAVGYYPVAYIDGQGIVRAVYDRRVPEDEAERLRREYDDRTRTGRSVLAHTTTPRNGDTISALTGDRTGSGSTTFRTAQETPAPNPRSLQPDLGAEDTAALIRAEVQAAVAALDITGQVQTAVGAVGVDLSHRLDAILASVGGGSTDAPRQDTRPPTDTRAEAGLGNDQGASAAGAERACPPPAPVPPGETWYGIRGTGTIHPTLERALTFLENHPEIATSASIMRQFPTATEAQAFADEPANTNGHLASGGGGGGGGAGGTGGTGASSNAGTRTGASAGGARSGDTGVRAGGTTGGGGGGSGGGGGGGGGLGRPPRASNRNNDDDDDDDDDEDDQGEDDPRRHPAMLDRSKGKTKLFGQPAGLAPAVMAGVLFDFDFPTVGAAEQALKTLIDPGNLPTVRNGSDSDSAAAMQEAANTLATVIGGANQGVTVSGDSGWRTKSRNTLENVKSQDELADLARRVMKVEYTILTNFIDEMSKVLVWCGLSYQDARKHLYRTPAFSMARTSISLSQQLWLHLQSSMATNPTKGKLMLLWYRQEFGILRQDSPTRDKYCIQQYITLRNYAAVQWMPNDLLRHLQNEQAKQIAVLEAKPKQQPKVKNCSHCGTTLCPSKGQSTCLFKTESKSEAKKLAREAILKEINMGGASGDHQDGEQ